jgi:hypothetical protein
MQAQVPYDTHAQVTDRSRRLIEPHLRTAQRLLAEHIAVVVGDLCDDPVWTVLWTPVEVHQVEVELCLAYGLDPDEPGVSKRPAP